MGRRRPLLYELPARIVVGEIGRALGRSATLDDLPDARLDEVAALGFDGVWLLGAWRTGPAARAVSLSRPDWRESFRRDLPDLADADVVGSPFAVQAYEAAPWLGGDAALARLRRRLARRGLALVLDFVPNHVGLDHPWVGLHPEWFVEGADRDLEREPASWIRVEGRVLAHGRDPNFPGWPDTLQLDHRRPDVREALVEELRRIAGRCDGVRCDMAMLVLPEVFRRTWGDRPGASGAGASFWPEAAARVRRDHPGFLLLAEAYWDLEWTLQEQGFDHVYDKRLYDRLRHGDARAVRAHLRAAPAFLERSAHFLENHDEPRAAAVFPDDRHRAAAVVAFLAPGLRLLQEGQLDGRAGRVSVHLGRRPDEPPSPALRGFYERLLAVLRRPEAHEGTWRLRDARAAWEGNSTFEQIVAMSWEGPAGRLLACANYGPDRAQARVEAGFPGIAGRRVLLADLLGDARYPRDGAELAARGLYLDVPPWGCHVFDVQDA